MLLERSVFLPRGLFLADLVLTALAWVLAWVVRFDLLTPPEWVPLQAYLLGFLPVVLVIWGGTFLMSGLYQTRRAQRLPLMVFAVARAVMLSLGVSLAALFFFRTFAFSTCPHAPLRGVLVAPAGGPPAGDLRRPAVGTAEGAPTCGAC